MQRLRACALVLAAAVLSGCFVFDELDKADAMMDAASPNAAERRSREKQQPQTAEAPTPSGSASEGPGIGERLQGWWKKATTPAPLAPDPSNVAVRCELPGGTQFMRKYDCQLRGGRFANLPPPKNDPSQN